MLAQFFDLNPLAQAEIRGLIASLANQSPTSEMPDDDPKARTAEAIAIGVCAALLVLVLLVIATESLLATRAQDFSALLRVVRPSLASSWTVLVSAWLAMALPLGLASLVGWWMTWRLFARTEPTFEWQWVVIPSFGAGIYCVWWGLRLATLILRNRPGRGLVEPSLPD